MLRTDAGAGPAADFHVAVVGAGPAGLATAAYTVSEGSSVLVLDTRAFGGHAVRGRGSKTTSGSRPASPATRWRLGRLSGRRSVARRPSLKTSACSRGPGCRTGLRRWKPCHARARRSRRSAATTRLAWPPRSCHHGSGIYIWPCAGVRSRRRCRATWSKATIRRKAGAGASSTGRRWNCRIARRR